MASEPFVLQPGRLTLAELRRIERDGAALALAPDIAALKELVQSDLFLDLVPSEARLTAGA